MTTPKNYTLTGSDVYSLERITKPVKGFFLKNLNRSKTWQQNGQKRNGEKFTVLKGYAEGYLLDGATATPFGYDISGSKLTPLPQTEHPRRVDEFRACGVEVVKVDLNEFCKDC